MAGRSQSDLGTVKEELFKLANRISQLQESNANNPVPNQSGQTSSHTRIESPQTRVSPITPQTSSLLEQRRLFNFGKRLSSSTQSRTSKQRKPVTYTLKFVCLASKNAERPPTTVKERTALSNSCLGPKSITFVENKSVYDTIYEHYPQLSDVGGFDFMLYQRGGGSDSGFHVINPPHTPCRLKDVCGQAKIYLRPAQKDIPLASQAACVEPCVETTEHSDEDLNQASNDEPVLKCFVCGIDLPFSKVREHTETHQNTGSNKQRQATLDECTATNRTEDVPETDMQTIQEIVPSATAGDIQCALLSVNGNVAEAVEQLLPGYLNNCLDDHDFTNRLYIIIHLNLLLYILSEMEYDAETTNIDEQLSIPVFEDATNIALPKTAIEQFQKENIDENQAQQRIFISRLDGVEELKKEVIGIYKNPKTKLKVGLKVRFEEEDAGGCGPVREFLSIAVNIIDKGIISASSKNLLFFEGEVDHRLPVHNQSLRLTGTFKALGKMLGHSVLHGGPGLHGVSPAVKCYMTCDQDTSVLQTLPLTLKDIPDLELRQLITEVDALPIDQKVNSNLKSLLEPYLFEAGLDPDELSTSRKKIIIDGLIMYQVIDKRRLELDDFAEGMEEVSLISFLKRVPSFQQTVFPVDAERCISAERLLDVLAYEEKDACEENKNTAGFFVSYINEVEHRTTGPAQLVDLISFWTAGNTIGDEKKSLLVKFSSGCKLPMAETCFRGIALPTMHASYEEFRKHMDIAVTYGSKGFDFT